MSYEPRSYRRERIGPVAETVEALLRFYSRITPIERGGFRLARTVRWLRHRSDQHSLFRTPDGFSLDLDLGTYPDCSMAFGLYELHTARLIRRLLNRGDHFIDGGANLGYFTLLASRVVGTSGRVDAVEPEPHNHARLMANVRRNGSSMQIRTHAVALSDKAGSADIHFFPNDAAHNHGCSSLFTNGQAATEISRVPTVRLDELFAGTRPRLVKLDIEGAEPLAVAGMTGLMQGDDPPDVILEYNPPAARIAGFAPHEAITRAVAAQPRYRVQVIGRKLHPIEPRPERLAELGQANLLLTCR